MEEYAAAAKGRRVGEDGGDMVVDGAEAVVTTLVPVKALVADTDRLLGEYYSTYALCTSAFARERRRGGLVKAEAGVDAFAVASYFDGRECWVRIGPMSSHALDTAVVPLRWCFVLCRASSLARGMGVDLRIVLDARCRGNLSLWPDVSLAVVREQRCRARPRHPN